MTKYTEKNLSLGTLTFNMTISVYNITLKSFETRREDNLLIFTDAVKEYFQSELVKSITIFSILELDVFRYMNQTIPGISFLCGLVLQNSQALQPEAFYEEVIGFINENQFDNSMFHNTFENTSDYFENAIFNTSPIASKSFLFIESDDGVDKDIFTPGVEIIVQPQEQPFEWWLLFYLLVLFLVIKFCSCNFKLKDLYQVFPAVNPPTVVNTTNTLQSPSPHSP